MFRPRAARPPGLAGDPGRRPRRVYVIPFLEWAGRLTPLGQASKQEECTRRLGSAKVIREYGPNAAFLLGAYLILVHEYRPAEIMELL